MAPAEVLAALAALRESDPSVEAMIAERRDAELAALLSAARPGRPVETFGGYGYVMERLGAETGASVLDALEALSARSSPVKWAFRLLERGSLDFGSAAVRAQLDALVAAGIMPAGAARALKAGAEVADPIDAGVVSDALNAEQSKLEGGK